jgi:hypothetical protein
MKNVYLLYLLLFSQTIIYAQEYCPPNQAQCHVCDAETDEDLEVIGYENSSYLVNEIFVKISPTLLPNINVANANFGNVQVNNLSDSYGLKSIQRMGDTDYYVLTFKNIKDLQCTIDGFDGLVDAVAQSSYFETVFPNFVSEETSIKNSEPKELGINTNDSKPTNPQYISTNKSNSATENIPTGFFVTPISQNFDKQWYLKHPINHLADIDARRAWSITTGKSTVNTYMIDRFFAFSLEDSRYGAPVYDLDHFVENVSKLPQNLEFFKIQPSHGEQTLSVYGLNGLKSAGYIFGSTNPFSGIDFSSTIKFASVGLLKKSYNQRTKKIESKVTADMISSLGFFVALKNRTEKTHVINNSSTLIPAETPDNETFKNTIMDVFINLNLAHPETLLVNSIGNEYQDTQTTFPLGSKILKELTSNNILTVALSDENDKEFSFENTIGSYCLTKKCGTAFGEMVDVVAPGISIVSLVAAFSNNKVNFSTNYNSFGASLSTPIVSGIASLIYSLQHESTQTFTGKLFTASEVKNMIITTAEKYMFASSQTNEQKIVTYPVARDEKLAHGRVNAHQAVLLSSAYLNHYIGDNKHVLRETENNKFTKIFSLPYDKVLFDKNKKYAVMLNRHKFSGYKLPEGDVTGDLIWESDIENIDEVNFDNFYAKELRLEAESLKLLTIGGATSWETHIPIVNYPDLGTSSNAYQCKQVTINAAGSIEEYCAPKDKREEHTALGLDQGHYISQWIEVSETTGHLTVYREYKNLAGEVEKYSVYSTDGGLEDKKIEIHRHLLKENLYTLTCEKSSLPVGSSLPQNTGCLISSDGNTRVVSIGNSLSTQRKLIDDDGEIMWEEVSSFNVIN